MGGVGAAINAVEMCDCTQLAHHHRQKFFVFEVIFALLDARRKALYGGFGAGEWNRTQVMVARTPRRQRISEGVPPNTLPRDAP